MGWGNDSQKKSPGVSGWGNTRKIILTKTPQETASTIETIRMALVDEGAITSDAGDGDWRVVFGDESGLLWTRCGIAPCVYTDSLPNSPFGRLLTKIGVDFCMAPRGGWAVD